MALGFEYKKDGLPYYGYQNYQKIHHQLGFKCVPNFYTNISRIHIDHINPIYLGGTASFDNGILICETCNLVFNKELTYEDKIIILNSDTELMDCDNIEYQAVNSNIKIIQNGRVFKEKDIVKGILIRRMENKKLLDIIPMYD